MTTAVPESPARPCVRATVVRAQEPASARPGDTAYVLPDGAIVGFVGGQCSTGAVRAAAAEALRTRESTLLRVLPDRGPGFPDSPGATVVVNPCLSGGALEIYLEPLLPERVVRVVGGSPTAAALARLLPTVGLPVCDADTEVEPGSLLATVVASHGGDELGAVRAALAEGAGLVGVVVSRTRGVTLLADLEACGLGPAELARVRPHPGLDIGARTPDEIALAITAALVRAVRVDGLAPADPDLPREIPAVAGEGPAPAAPEVLTTIDPVCGMSVVVRPGTPHAVVDGADVWFCCPGCRDAHVAAAS